MSLRKSIFKSSKQNETMNVRDILPKAFATLAEELDLFSYDETNSVVMTCNKCNLVFVWPDPEGISQGACYVKDGKRIMNFNTDGSKESFTPEYWIDNFQSEIDYVSEIGIDEYVKEQNQDKMGESLFEMAALPSLKQLQRMGNKKPATKEELKNARKRALRLKTPREAREAAKSAWENMQKRQIIQIFLDREAELINPKRPVPKPLFMDQKIIKWSALDNSEKESAIRWLAGSKTENQLVTLLTQAKAAKKSKITPDATAKVSIYEAAIEEWKKNHKHWRDTANKISHHFGAK